MIHSRLLLSSRFFLLSWLFYSLLAFLPSPLHAEEVNVILLGGQSNATSETSQPALQRMNASSCFIPGT